MRLRNAFISLIAVAVAAFSLPQVALANDSVKSSPLLDRNRNRMTDDLEAILASKPPGATVDVIAMFDHAPGRIHGRVRARWNLVPGVAATMTKAQIVSLAARSDVVHIEPDRTVRIAMSTARRYEGVDKAVTDFNINGDRTGNRKIFSSSDVVACVIDTGVDTTHVDLDQGQVIAWKDYVNGRTTPYDDNGHGSHVAGILAGQGDGNTAMRGVAYGAALVEVKALSSSGSGSSSTLISAINWCVANRSTYHIKILSMSFGSSSASDGTDTLSTAVDAAYDQGLLPVVAAGNAGPASGTIGAPAAARKALTVCSVADPGEAGFSISPFSSRGPTLDGRTKPDVCAPGTNITSVKAGSVNGYTTLSGGSIRECRRRAVSCCHAIPGSTKTAGEGSATCQGRADPPGQRSATKSSSEGAVRDARPGTCHLGPIRQLPLG